MPLSFGETYVWVLRITHRHGDDLSVHRSEAGAWVAAATFAMQYAEEEGISLPADGTPEQVATVYFDAMGDREKEWFGIEKCKL